MTCIRAYSAADVSRTLDPRNRDKFTQNLTAFRHELHTR